MKSRVVVVLSVCVVGFFIVLTTGTVNRAGQPVDNSSHALPASLAQYYPPNTPAPAYLLAMHDLARPFSGVICDVQEGDLENARQNFSAFRDVYAEVAGMIPEWSSAYPTEPLATLETALTGGDPAAVMPAVAAMGAVCHNCHVRTMAQTQQRYRWDRFGDIALTDPLSGRDVGFAELMLMMEVSFQGIANDLAQDQLENARAQFDGFAARFAEVAEACAFCHETKRTYFVSEDITGKIATLRGELEKPEIDGNVVEGLMQSIGQESCAKCHLVHIPAAYGQQMAEVH
ncbi:MAG TPA: hypothetical protein VLB27_08740 [candidate division Zixibacteria bacterium]|nr:hypothetical protein [candidate division Zixibacteria bacterium]